MPNYITIVSISGPVSIKVVLAYNFTFEFSLPSILCSKANADITCDFFLFLFISEVLLVINVCTWPKSWQFCLFRCTSYFQLSFQSNSRLLCFKVHRLYLSPLSYIFLFANLRSSIIEVLHFLTIDFFFLKAVINDINKVWSCFLAMLPVRFFSCYFVAF